MLLIREQEVRSLRGLGHVRISFLMNNQKEIFNELPFLP